MGWCLARAAAADPEVDQTIVDPGPVVTATGNLRGCGQWRRGPTVVGARACAAHAAGSHRLRRRCLGADGT